MRLFQVHVANRLGVSEERVRELRAAPNGPLEEGVDWMKEGNRIVYSEGAVGKLAAALAGETTGKLGEKEEAAVEPAEAAAETPAGIEIVVAKLWPNPRYVAGVVLMDSDPRSHPGFAPVPEGRPLVRVRVRSSLCLARGMVMAECRHLGSDLYECDRLPRRKGQW
jgi:hypothetical protein